MIAALDPAMYNQRSEPQYRIRLTSGFRYPRAAPSRSRFCRKFHPSGCGRGSETRVEIRRRRGQASIEFAILYGLVIVPLVFGIVFVAQMYWTWHSMAEFTREGARYAATHCWQGDSNNVVSYMQTHVPPVVDRDQFQSGGSATINVEYFQRDPDSGQLVAFSCTGDCSPDCVPDAVNVSVTNYEFRRFVNYLRLPPVAMPSFLTSMPIASNGCDPEQNTCNP